MRALISVETFLCKITGGAIHKSSCSGCGICSTCTPCGSLGNGCLEYLQHSIYELNVTCYTEGYYENDFGFEILTVQVEQNPPPTINLDGKEFSCVVHKFYIRSCKRLKV